MGAPKLIRELVQLARQDARTFREICRLAGVDAKLLTHAGTPKSVYPHVASLIAVGQVLGYELEWRKK